MSKLTGIAVSKAKPRAKQYKLADSGGMYLLVHQSGSKYWRYDYSFSKKRKTIALGIFPDVSLASARKLHQQAREALASGQDPNELKKDKKLGRDLEHENSFEAIGREWFDNKMEDKSDSHKKRSLRILEKDLYPSIGYRPIKKITVPEILGALRKIEARGSIDIAHRAKQLSGQIFRYAIASGRAETDPSRDLGDALKTHIKKHYAAITDPLALGKLLIAIDGFSGTPAVKSALQLSALLFQRPGEIRHMEWVDINWNDEQWEIPAKKMKMKHSHIVPLSRQSLVILRHMESLKKNSNFVFPSARGGSRPLSENGVRTALRSMG
nr:integrase arm-type DNA-binding domain-containing protein [Candidatus Neomarinimicrobiota bacterium]